MKLVIVESPAKARTIEKYLGADYKVLASYGHVRDLPEKQGSVRPDEDFAMDWTIDPKSHKHMSHIRSALRQAERLILATDPDREGEAISWHLCQELARQKALAGKAVERVKFHQVTRSAVLDAIDNPRPLDDALVSAYLARRALDYLVGFTLSPVLWRKLPVSGDSVQSAGRVQSVALRLITDREAEIEQFQSREYWTVEALLRTTAGGQFTAHLTHLAGKRLGKFGLASREDAERAVKVVNACAFTISGIERKRVARNPQPPFTTSTLQQEASRKLGMSADHTMRIAQRLYEGAEMGAENAGLITYMRTDSVNMSAEATARIRQTIERTYGASYVPERPRGFRNRAKNAQEAHEAIRPVDVNRHPKDVARYLDVNQARLYELIWKRAVASQMASAQLAQTTATIDGVRTAVSVKDGSAGTPAADAGLRATGSVVVFDGFLALYREGSDEPVPEEEREGRILPPMDEGEALERLGTTPERHETQPPPRYSEASLVKRMEELGIGRPSTYATTLRKLQDRKYVRLERRRFIPEDRGRLVTAFLVRFFQRYVEFDFTAQLETELDDIAAGRLEWKDVLRRFWEQFVASVEDASHLTITRVLDEMTEELGSLLFPARADGTPDRDCPQCGVGQLSLKLGRHGPFLGCSRYPECKHTRSFSPVEDSPGNDDGTLDGPRDLGIDPETRERVTVRKGPYGPYVQLGEQGEDAGDKPKRTSLPKNINPGEIDLSAALSLLSLPRSLGAHPETGEPITAGIGRYGPYVRRGKSYVSVPERDNIVSLDLDRAVELIARSRKGSAGKVLGESDGAPVSLKSGRFGPYVEHRKVRATVPKSTDPDSVTLEVALELIEAKAAKGGSGAPKKKSARTPARKGAPARKGSATRKGTRRTRPASDPSAGRD